MTWLKVVESDLLPRYGEPRIRPGAEAPGLKTERGWCRRWAWVWFPDGVNHHFAVDRYDESDQYNVRAGHHGSSALRLWSTNISFWRKGEPSPAQVLAVLSLAELLDPIALPRDMWVTSMELVGDESGATS